MIETTDHGGGVLTVQTVRCPARHCDDGSEDWKHFSKHVFEEHCGEDFGLPPLDARRPWEDREHLVPLEADLLSDETR